jgi:hypothetical protein
MHGSVDSSIASINETIRRLAEAGSEASGVDDSRLRQAKKKLADAETQMRRLQLSIEAGVEPAAFADALNRALEEREAARADLDRVPTTNVLTEKKIAEIVDGLGNVAELLNSADPSELAALYAALRLEMVYSAAAKIVGVSIRPTGWGSNRVRGDLPTNPTRRFEVLAGTLRSQPTIRRCECIAGRPPALRGGHQRLDQLPLGCRSGRKNSPCNALACLNACSARALLRSAASKNRSSSSIAW